MKISAKRFEELIVWQEARKMNKQVFDLFKDCKYFFFRDQILKASLSVSSNIAEGFERKSNKEFKRFLNIAKASCGEVRSQLYLGIDTNLIDTDTANSLIEHCNRIAFLIYKLSISIPD